MTTQIWYTCDLCLRDKFAKIQVEQLADTEMHICKQCIQIITMAIQLKYFLEHCQKKVDND